MDEDKIKEVVRDYIRENLKVEVQVNVGSSGSVRVEVTLMDGEVLLTWANDTDYIEFPNEYN